MTIEPITAGDNENTPFDRTDASRPCRPQTSPTPSYNAAEGCYINRSDLNCINPNRISVGVLYATTEECRNMRPTDDPQRTPGDPAHPPQDPPEFCSSSGAVGFANPNEPARPNDGVKARGGVADLFLTAGPGSSTTDPQTASILHISVANAFADVRCDPQGVAQFDARSQVVYANLGNQLALDLIPGLFNQGPTGNLNNFASAGPFRFNATYINDNEPGGAQGTREGVPQPLDPVSGRVRLNVDPTTQAPVTVYKVTQRAFELTSMDGRAASTIVAGEAQVDIATSEAEVLAGQGACRPDAQRGRIVIDKVTTPQPDNTAFDFTFNPGNQAFTLRDADPPREFANLQAGTYTVTEAERAGYTQTVACTDPSGGTTTAGRTATIGLAAGETVTCTFTNAKPDGRQARITIRKNTVPNDPQNFRFRGSGTIGAFQLDDDNDPTLPRQRTFTVTPGAYTVVEAPQRGFTLTAINCAGDPTGNSRGDVRTATAMIDVAAGESVLCTFVNRKDDVECPDDEDDDNGRDEDNDGRDDDDDGRDEDRVDADGDGRDDDDDGRDDDGDGRDEDRDPRDNDRDGRDDDGDGRDRDRDDRDEDGDDNDNDGDDRNGNDGDDNGDECDDDDRGVADLDVQPDEFRPDDNNGGAAVAAASKRRGARVLYRLDRSTRVKFQVQRLSGKRYVTMKGSFTHRGRKGRNMFRYTGHLAGRKLAPGRYRLVATARTKKGKVLGAVEKTRFRILR